MKDGAEGKATRLYSGCAPKMKAVHGYSHSMHSHCGVSSACLLVQGADAQSSI